MRKRYIAVIVITIAVIGSIFGYLIYNSLLESPSTDEYEYDPPKIAGTDYLSIRVYNKSIWERVFGNNSSPIDLFGSNSDVLNASCKFIKKGFENNSIDIFEMMEFLFGVIYDEVDKIMLKQSLDIGDEWNAWIITKDIWMYSIEEDFNSTPDKKDMRIPVLQNPYDFIDILEEFQILINKSYLAIDYLSALDLIYHLILKRIDIPTPVSTYLTETIEYLQPQNISVINGSILRLSKKEKEIFYIYSYYNNKTGVLEKLNFYDQDLRLFYQQCIIPPENGGYFMDMLLIISLVVIPAGVAGIIITYVLKRKE